MRNFSELVLSYDPLPLADHTKQKAVLAGLGIGFRPVAASELGQTVGFLAGLEGFLARQSPHSGPAPSEPVLVFCGLDRDRLDLALDALREAGVSKGLKAALTGTNCAWPFAKLAGELQEERAAIAKAARKED